MSPKYKKWLFLAIVALIPILSGCDGCDKKKYVAPPPAPSAPSNLSGSAVSSTQIDLAWQDNSTNEKGFHLYRRTTDSYSKVAILEVNATSYSDTGLSSETTYSYKVKAYNDGGESGSSNVVTIATLAGSEPEPGPELQAPSNLTATALSYKYIQLFWDDNSTDENGFRVRCDMGRGDYQTVATLEPDYTFYGHDFLQPMTGYRYYIQVYRGSEHANSSEAVATTPCPVVLVDYNVVRGSLRRFVVSGTLTSTATEPSETEITASFYNADTGELVGIEIHTVSLKALEEMKDFEFEHILQTETAGDIWCDYTVEITDVEIEY